MMGSNSMLCFPSFLLPIIMGSYNR